MTRVALIIVGLLLLAGCGDQPAYDHVAVQRYLEGSQGWRFPDAKATGPARCPSEHALSEGMTLRCTLAVSGAQVPFLVTLRGVRTEAVTVTATPDGVILSGSKLAEVVALGLPETARGAKVECGGSSAIVVAKIGERVACSLALGSQRLPFTVTVKDAAGRVVVDF